MTGLFAFEGNLRDLDPSRRARLLDRGGAAEGGLRERTAQIIGDVRRHGDAALIRLAAELDGASLGQIEVPRSRCRRALDRLEPPLRRALERAATNIRQVHEAFHPDSQRHVTADGVTLTRRVDPLDRVGVYAPGGRAAYCSSVLMGVIPAQVAGVPHVIVCSPPARDGAPSPLVLAAAVIGGAESVFASGGAGAIAAMAYGTETIPRVDRIVGPGNAWVTEAKLQVGHTVGLDAPAGPSELLILADESAAPGVLAGELVAQAEHDPLAAVVLLSTAPSLLGAVADAIRGRLGTTPRAGIVRAALASRSAALGVQSLDDALAFAADFAAEHVLLACRDARSIADRVRHAGTVFVGHSSSVVFGDYLTGANHVLPTGGSARSWSGLSTSDFVRWTTLQEVGPDAAARLAADVECLARAEGLPAHAEAARAWSRRP